MVKRFYQFIFVLLIAVFFVGCEKQTPPEEYFETTGFVMDTVVIQRLYGENRVEAARLGELRLHQLEQQLSPYLEDSLIANLNSQAGVAPVMVEEEAVFAMLQTAKDYSAYAPEIFNITAGPLISLWQIGKEGFQVPEPSQIEGAKQLIAIDDLVLDADEKTAYLQREGQSIDLGGIAKGIACEELKKIYKEAGVEQGIISLGGNLILLDGKPDGSDLEVGIRSPFGNANQYFAIYQGRNVVISTSGGYERYSTEAGKNYAHVLDLQSGYPVDNDLSGVTVICENGALGDYLSTYIYICGLERGKELLTDARFGVILVDKEKNVFVSPHLLDKVRMTDKDFLLQTVE